MCALMPIGHQDTNYHHFYFVRPAFRESCVVGSGTTSSLYINCGIFSVITMTRHSRKVYYFPQNFEVLTHDIQHSRSSRSHSLPGPRLNTKTVFPGIRIPMLKIRRPRDRLIFNMGIPKLARRHLYIETHHRLRICRSFDVILTVYKVPCQRVWCRRPRTKLAPVHRRISCRLSWQGSWPPPATQPMKGNNYIINVPSNVIFVLMVRSRGWLERSVRIATC